MQQRRQCRYNRDAVERFLCAHHRVEKPWQFQPFGNLIECWEMMRPVQLTVEAQIPPTVQFDVRNPDPEKQAVRCVVGSDLCRMMDSPEPPDKSKVVHPRTKQPFQVDLERVYPYSVVTRHVRSDLPIPVVMRLNYYHSGLNVLERLEEHDDFMTIGGSIKGAYIAIERTPDCGKDMSVAGLQRREFSYCNEFFVATMALVNEDNLRNGIVPLPPDLCLAAGLPIYRGAPEPPEELLAGAMDELCDEAEGMSISEDHVERSSTSRSREEMVRDFKSKWEENAERMVQAQKYKRVSMFYAVPINHVLAWGLQSEEYCRRHQVFREEFFFSPPPEAAGKDGKMPDDILLYYLVPDVTFDAIMANFCARWMGKVDARPLKSIAFDFVPLTGARRYPQMPPNTFTAQGAVSARSTIDYMVAPKLSRKQIAALAPALAPTFMSCRQWDPVEAERERQMLEEFAEK